MTDPHYKIVDYAVETCHVTTLKDMAERIHRMVSDGWEPYGTLIENNHSFIQVLVKREPLEKQSEFVENIFAALMDKIDRLENRISENGR